MGSGCAFLDYDGDGRLDLFLVNSSRLPGFKGKGPSYPALYHQQPDGSFEDVTKKAGLAIDCYGMGVAAGDYDNDGRPDLYLTAYGGCHLFHNSGDGTFADVTRRAGVSGPAWGTSAAWFDYNRDGFLDLFVCNYCHWTPALNQSCGDSSGRYICAPRYYSGAASVLYRSNHDGTFTDVTKQAGVGAPTGKALGIVVWDFDGDGWPDFAVSNDTVPNWLFHNNRNGTFSEVGVEDGVAYSDSGRARAGMGLDTADYEDNGREALVIGNNLAEGLGLYRPQFTAPGVPGHHFLDMAPEAGLFEPSMPFSTFGALFVDADRDGYPDLVTANGHETEQLARLGGGPGLAERMELFHNEPGVPPVTRRFREIGRSAGDIAREGVWRGLATGDFDGDGKPDLLVTANNGRAALLRNDTRNGNHWLALHPRGVKSNRDGLGTRVVLQAAGRREQTWVRSGASYCSDSEHVARFGLGAATEADLVELHWPSGIIQTLRHVKADRLLEVIEAAR